MLTQEIIGGMEPYKFKVHLHIYLSIYISRGVLSASPHISIYLYIQGCIKCISTYIYLSIYPGANKVNCPRVTKYPLEAEFTPYFFSLVNPTPLGFLVCAPVCIYMSFYLPIFYSHLLKSISCLKYM